MAFFADDIVTESSTALSEIEATPCYIENYHEAVLGAVAENESNYNVLMKHIGIHEYTSYKTTGQVVYTEGALSNFWEKVKKFFAAVYAKIKGIFNNFMSRFDAYWKGGKSFYDKYKRQLVEKFPKTDTEKIKFMGYKFNDAKLVKNDLAGSGVLEEAKNILGETIPADIKSLSATASDNIIKKRETVEQGINSFRGKLLGGSGSFTQKEFSKELFEHFRGDSKKTEIDGVTLDSITKVLSDDKLSKAISDSYTSLEKDVTALIRLCETGQKESIDAAVGTDPTSTDATKAAGHSKSAAYPIIIGVFKDILTAKQTYLAAQMQAVKDRVGQAKTFAAQILRGPVKESGSWETYGEGATDNTGGSDFLSGITFK